MSDVDAAETAEDTAEETSTPESTPDGPDSGGPTDSPTSGGGDSGDSAPFEWALPIGAVLLALAAGLGGWFLRGSTESAVSSAEAVADQGSVPPEVEGFFDSFPEGLEEFFTLPDELRPRRGDFFGDQLGDLPPALEEFLERFGQFDGPAEENRIPFLEEFFGGESPLRDFFERRDFFEGSEGFGDLFGVPGDRREFEDPLERFRDRFGDRFGELDGLEGLEEFFRMLPQDRRPERSDFFSDQPGDLPPGLEEFLDRFRQFRG